MDSRGEDFPRLGGSCHLGLLGAVKGFVPGARFPLLRRVAAHGLTPLASGHVGD